MVKNHTSLVHSTLKLFNAVPVRTSRKKRPSEKVIEQALVNGLVISPRVVANYSEEELQEIIKIAGEEIGLSAEQMNACFHKSWGKVKHAPSMQLVFEQAMHYLTTYGFERMGIYDNKQIYIPHEQFDVPAFEGNFMLNTVNGLNRKELKEKLMILLESGVALSHMEEIMEICKFVGVVKRDLEKMKNREVMVRLFDMMDMLPTEPIDFLRYMVFKTTDSSLLINDQKTMRMIEERADECSSYFQVYDEEVGYKRLGEIFNRFKPLFMSFKGGRNMSPIINKISHLSKKYHKTLPMSVMNNVTGLIKQGETITKDRVIKAMFMNELEQANIFRKIRLLSALNFRLNDPKGVVYKIRNGKAHVDEVLVDNMTEIQNVYNIVLESITNDLKHLKGKKFHIPEGVNYALPATQKQFTGNLPSGSYISIPNNMIFGVYWDNVKGNRIDLDLSVNSIVSGKIGWDRSHRNSDRTIMFSGDMTDASNGASELFYVRRVTNDILVLNLNYFNFRADIPVPFKIMIGQETPYQFGSNYMINPNSVKAMAKTEAKERQMILGLVVMNDEGCRFYFNQTNQGNLISARGGGETELVRDYLINSTTGMINLNDIIEFCGGELVSSLERYTEGVIDLSPDVVDKTTFISLLSGKL